MICYSNNGTINAVTALIVMEVEMRLADALPLTVEDRRQLEAWYGGSKTQPRLRVDARSVRYGHLCALCVTLLPSVLRRFWLKAPG